MLIIQLTGLSGAGKTTISNYVKQVLESNGLLIEIIDGDIYRKTLCADLGFSEEDRKENIRRLGKAAFAFTGNRDAVIIAAINPFEEIRKELKANYGVKTVWINCAIDTLISRDTKGLYKRALLHDEHPDKLRNLTGVNDTYDLPVDSDLVIDTHEETLVDSGKRLCDFILQHISL